MIIFGADSDTLFNQQSAQKGAKSKVGVKAGPLRICLVSGTYPPARCGVGDYTERLAGALVDQGAEVSVITSSYLEPTSTANPTVLPVVNSWAMGSGLEVVRRILQTQPQIVHFQFPTTEYYSHRLFDLLVAMLKLWPRRTKLVVTLHETGNRQEKHRTWTL